MKTLLPLLLSAGLGCLAHADETRARILIQADSGELQAVGASEGARIVDMSSSAKDPEKAKRTVVVTAPISADQWTTFSATVKASGSGQAKLRLSGDFEKGGDSWALIDNVKGDGVEITNGDFEDSAKGAPKGWMLQKTDGKQGETVTDGNTAASGENFVKVSHTYPVIQSIPLPADREVTITLSARATKQP